MLSKLSRETLADQAARNLIAFIETQNLKPGNLLPPETQLAASLGVSRPIIREALKSLAGRGIIEVVNGKGAMIKPLDSELLQMFFRRAMQIEPEAIIDMMELRSVIEVRAAALATQRRSDEELAVLAEIVASMRQHLYDPEAYVEADLAFHRQIASMTQNTVLCYVLVAIRQAIKEFLHESLLRPHSAAHLERVQSGHEAILAALAEGDAERAQRAMAAHFDDAVTSLLDGSAGKPSSIAGDR